MGSIDKAALTACTISADAIYAAAESTKAAVAGAKGAEITSFFARVGMGGRGSGRVLPRSGLARSAVYTQCLRA